MFERIFRWNTPAEENFFALTLFFAGTWIAVAIFFVLLLHGYVGGRTALFSASGLALAFLLYAATLGCFYTPLGLKHLAYRLAFVLLVLPVALFAPTYCFPQSPAALIPLLLLVCWAGPLVFSPRSWRWALPAAAVWSLGIAALFLPVISVSSVSEAIWLSRSGYFGVFCCFVGWFLTGVRYARRDGVPVRRVFGGRTALLLIVFAAVYLFFIGLWLHSMRETRQVINRLERHFGRPLTVAGLADLCRSERRTDAAFWEKYRSLSEELSFEKRIDIRHMPPEIELPEPEYAKWRDDFDRSAELKQLEALVDVGIPAYPWKFEPGNGFGAEMPSLFGFRNLADCEAWRVRLALERRDAATALVAWDRMGKIGDLLTEFPLLVSSVCCLEVENCRLNAAEQLLSAGLLTDAQLETISAAAAATERRLPGFERRSIYMEAMSCADVVEYYSMFEILMSWDDRPDLRFSAAFLGPVWGYWSQINRREMLKKFCIDSWRQELNKNTKLNETLMILPTIMGWSFRSLGDRFLGLAARCAAMRALIGVELEKRRTGKYPAELKTPPVDPFTGKPMKYRVGVFRRVRWGRGGVYGDPVIREVQGVAVWSVGPNGRDDGGLRMPRCEDRPDDCRALLVFPPKAVPPRP